VSRRSFFLGRFAGMAFTVWAVFTAMFAYVVSRPNFGDATAGDGVPAARNDPFVEQYVDWLVWLLTLWDAPVMAHVLDRLPYTLVYFVPAVAFAVVVGIAVRAYTVASKDGRLDEAVDGFTFLAVSVPSFLLAYVLKWWFLPHYFRLTGRVRVGYDAGLGALAPKNLEAAMWPVTVMGLYLFAIQLRFAGEQLDEYVSAEFVKTVRAKGAGVWRVGLHVFRNAAVPLLTVFFTDMFGMVVVGMFVIEYVTGVPGFAELTIHAVLDGNLPLLLAVVVLSVLVGVVANFAQDVGYAVFDPRVRYGE